VEILYNVIIGDYNSAETIGVKQKVISQAKALNDLGCNCYLKLVTTSNIKGGVVFEDDFKFEIQPLKVKNVLLRRKEIFSIFYKNTVSKNFDIIYIRYPLADPYFINYLKKVYSKNKIIIEHQAIEKKELMTAISANKILKYISEIYYHRKIKEYISGIVTVTKEIEEYQKKIMGGKLKSIVIGNGIDTDKVPLRYKWNREKNIRLLFVGNISPWHGLDKLIMGLSQLDFVYKGYPIKLEIIGEGNSYSQIKELVRTLKGEKYIMFHGFLENDNKYEILSNCDIAIGSLASERRGLNESSNIKLREYCAFGIPFIKTDYDADFDHNRQAKLFTFTIKNCAKLNWLDQILDFAINIKGNSEISLLMREYAENFLDWHIKIRKLMNFFYKIKYGEL